MSKSKPQKFTYKQARFLCDALDAHGWTVFDKTQELSCPSCGDGQAIEWDYCPFCGADHAENPCERDTAATREIITLMRDLVIEALSEA